MRAWIRRKWETAEEWLPWFLGITSVLILVIGLAVGFLRGASGGSGTGNGPRTPAAFIEITNSDDPSSEPSSKSSGSGSRIKIGTRRSPNSNSSSGASSSGPAFVIQVQDSRPPEQIREEIQSRTGVPARRARAVVLVANKLTQPVGSEMKMDLALFPDLTVPVKLGAVSDYEVNEGIRSGVIENDESSRVSLMTADGMVSGFITYRGVQYRIVADPNRGVHYIIEVR